MPKTSRADAQIGTWGRVLGGRTKHCIAAISFREGRTFCNQRIFRELWRSNTRPNQKVCTTCIANGAPPMSQRYASASDVAKRRFLTLETGAESNGIDLLRVIRKVHSVSLSGAIRYIENGLQSGKFKEIGYAQQP